MRLLSLLFLCLAFVGCDSVVVKFNVRRDNCTINTQFDGKNLVVGVDANADKW